MPKETKIRHASGLAVRAPALPIALAQCHRKFGVTQHAHYLRHRYYCHITDNAGASRVQACHREGPGSVPNLFMRFHSFISNLSDDRSTAFSKTIPPLNTI
jgi:hypothetical protein